VGVGQHSFTREKAVNIGVYSVGSQHEGSFFMEYRPRLRTWGRITSRMGLVRNVVKLNRLSGHQMSESHGSGKWKSAEVFRKSERLWESRERESAEDSENSVRIVAPAVRNLGCLTVRASRNSIFVEQCRLALPSPLVLPFFIVLASLRAVASLLALASLLVSADLLQGSHSQPETHMRGERVRHKIASREGRASSVVARRPLSGSHSSRKPTGQDFSATDGTDIDCRKMNCSATGCHADAAACNAQ